MRKPVLMILLFIAGSLILQAQDAAFFERDWPALMRRGTEAEIRNAVTVLENSSFPEDSDMTLAGSLHYAALWNRDPGVMTVLVEAGADVNGRDELGRTPLMAAARNNTPAVCAELFRLGADPGLKDINGQTAAHLAAAFSGENGVAESLVRGGADLNARDNRGRTPFEFALPRQTYRPVLREVLDDNPDPLLTTAEGHTLYSLAFDLDDPVRRSMTVEVLFAGGASLKGIDPAGRTPLEEARDRGMNGLAGELEIYQAQLQDALSAELSDPSRRPPAGRIQSLLDRGADPAAPDWEGLTPCHRAVLNGFPESLVLLLREAAPVNPLWEISPELADSQLLIALEHESETAAALIEILLDEGFSPDVIGYDGNPLLTKSLYKSLAVTEMLLRAGADTELRDNYGATAFMRAAVLDSDREGLALDLLLQYGADLYGADQDKWNALFYAVLFGGDLKVIKKLVLLGLEPDSTDTYGTSVFLWACAYNPDVEVVEFLIGRGAGLNRRDKDGWTPLMAALNWGNRQDIVEYLIRHTRDGRVTDGVGRGLGQFGSVYEEKTGHSVPDSLDYLIRYKRVYPPDGIPREGSLDEALHDTAEWGPDPSVALLLTGAGADIRSRGRDGWTPLMKAAAYNESGMVKALLEEGAEADTVTALGWTSLHVAAWSNDPVTTALLLEAGGDVKARDAEGWTPLLWAARNRASAGVLDVLLEAGADPRALTDSLETALILAVSGWDEPDPDSLDLLISRGCDINAADGSGMTALMEAAALGYERACRILLEAGADPYATDLSGYTAFDYAEADGHAGILLLLGEF